ncbi:MAG: ATP-grasp fold amidoligase family protein [Bacillota bacterium]|nr:ATP-grasp fold amidoligase family protein [Bacillota bacterium]
MFIKRSIRKLYYFILSFLPTRMVIYIEYFRYTRSLPNLSNPTKFSDKFQCMKLDNELESYCKYVDKYEVREFVKKTIGEKYLNKLIAVYDRVEDIDFDTLPNRFVLKCTHGSGYNIICSNIKELEISKTKKKLKNWMREDFYSITREPQYKLIKPKIICEEYLDDSNDSLIDYKFFCFNGEPKFIQVVVDRNIKHKENFYNMNWQKLNMKACYKKTLYENTSESISRPKNMEEMILLAEKLSKDFKFVRVDFYSVNDQTIFGELTFVPASGFTIYIPHELNYHLGNLLE